MTLRGFRSEYYQGLHVWNTCGTGGGGSVSQPSRNPSTSKREVRNYRTRFWTATFVETLEPKGFTFWSNTRIWIRESWAEGRPPSAGWHRINKYLGQFSVLNLPENWVQKMEETLPSPNSSPLIPFCRMKCLWVEPKLGNLCPLMLICSSTASSLHWIIKTRNKQTLTKIDFCFTGGRNVHSSSCYTDFPVAEECYHIHADPTTPLTVCTYVPG